MIFFYSMRPEPESQKEYAQKEIWKDMPGYAWLQDGLLRGVRVVVDPYSASNRVVFIGMFHAPIISCKRNSAGNILFVANFIFAFHP